ncbi:ATP-binding protein [Celeribacter sp.]|uniref:sensor histidine kinase n=1 Tax=Celeribacter sp. TaxID=1890673 RepID=UPI003A94C2A1
MPDKNRVQSMNRLIESASYVAILGLCFLIYLGATRTASIVAGEEQFDRMYRDQSVIATRIQQSINKKLLFARGLAGALSLSPDITEAEFTDLCSFIKTEDASVVNMALVQGTIITHVHPYEENHSLVGKDLANLPEQKKVLQLVERRGETYLEGPTRLFQGYQGFIIREPVFIRSGGDQGESEMIGVASIVFAVDPFLQDIGLSEFDSRYNIAIRVKTTLGKDPVIFGDETSPLLAKTNYELPFPGSSWTLSIAPIHAAQIAPKTLFLIRLSILTGAALALIFTRYLHVLRRKNWRTATQLRTALNVAPSGFVMFDKDDKLELCNVRYRDLHGAASNAIVTGASLEDILRAGLRVGLYPDAIGQEDEWLSRQLMRTAQKESGVTLALNNDTWMQLLEHETPEGGRVAILNDITEVQSSRNRAKLAEQRLNDAINALPVGFWLFDSDDKLIMFNIVAGEKLDGVRRNLMIGRALTDLIQRRFEISDEVRLNGVPVHDQTLILNAMTGETSELEVRYSGDRWFKYFTRRTSEGGLVMFRVEITDLRRHQQELEASNRELRAALCKRDEAEARLQDVSDLSSEWFWEQDAEMRLTHVSEGFARTIGVDPAEYIGKHRSYFAESEHGDAETLWKLHDKMQAHEPFRDIVYSYHFHPDQLSWIRISGKPLFDAEGAFTGYIGIAEDVTKFYAALREAEQADEAKTQFLNVISHELRTPLTAVLGFNSFVANFEKLPSYAALRVALEDGGDNKITEAMKSFEADISRFTTRIQASGTQLKALIDDMLDIARIESNTLRISPNKVQSTEVIESVVEQMQSLAEEKGLSIELELTDAAIHADEIRFRQILTNLLGNAVKFTDNGTIQLRSYVRGDMAIFEIKDSGIGIAEDRIDIIFDRFAQAASGTNRKNPGVGLGLAICKDLIALQDGWIKAESELGVGSTMIFALPRWEEGNQEAYTLGV